MVSAVTLNVGHAVFAVVAQGRIVVVGQQRDQVIGTVPGWGNQPEGGAAGAGVVLDSLPDWRVGGQGEHGLGQDGAFFLRPGEDAQDLLGLIQSNGADRRVGAAVSVLSAAI